MCLHGSQSKAWNEIVSLAEISDLMMCELGSGFEKVLDLRARPEVMLQALLSSQTSTVSRADV